MPSSSRRRRGDVLSRAGLFRPTTPHFVKVMLLGSLRLGKMEIPPRFAREYLRNFSGAVKLKLPNDDVWSVKLELSEGKLWLGKGWRKLQDHYRLKKGSLLLFHLEGQGKAVFHVSIFDLSCSEIDYPVKVSNNSISSESEDGSHDSLAIDYSSSADSMPSGSRRSRRGVRSNVGFFGPNSPHFMKVMLPESIRRGKMEIPPKFARKYGENFSEGVELTVPSDDAWLVKLKLSEGNFWLWKGWMNFQSHYALETGSFLLFQLDGNSAFQVLIFDPSGTEIDYPLKNTPRVRPEPSNHFIPSEMEDDGNDSPAETESDSGPASKKRQYERRSRRLSPSELVVLIDTSDNSSSTDFVPSEMEDDSLDSLAETESDSGPVSKKRQRKRQTRRLRPSELVPMDISDSPSADSLEWYESDRPELEGTSSRRPLRSSAKPRCFREPLPRRSPEVLKAAQKFHTNGFSFMIQMRKSYMRSGGVSISKDIMLAADIDEGFHRVELRHDGEAWPVKMLCYKEEHRGKLCRGWLDFLKGNEVRAGDVCVFELVEKDVFDVHIFKCPIDS